MNERLSMPVGLSRSKTLTSQVMKLCAGCPMQALCETPAPTSCSEKVRSSETGGGRPTYRSELMDDTVLRVMAKPQARPLSSQRMATIPTYLPTGNHGRLPSQPATPVVAAPKPQRVIVQPQPSPSVPTPEVRRTRVREQLPVGGIVADIVTSLFSIRAMSVVKPKR